jgi:glycosyltransferase involved in cell wall biosynthesis
VKIALVSDAWRPQVNGVVRTTMALIRELNRAGHDVAAITPDLFQTIPCPFYSEIRLAVGARKRMARRLDSFAPDAIHLATEGPLGLAARRYCIDRAIPFTTAYCTRFPEYIAARFGFPAALSYWTLRRFHSAASGVMVATESIRSELAARGFQKLRRWTRGVDTDHFHPAEKSYFQMPRPVFLTVGRVALEKNLRAFLDLDLPGSKIVVGDGPQRISPASRTRRLSCATTPLPMSSSFPVAPIRSASSCSRRSPPAFPSPPSRWRVRST